MGLMEKFCSLSGALLFAQFPAFFQQYTHELYGHLAELTYQNSILEQSAKLANKTLPQLIYKFTSSLDPDFQKQGHFMQSIGDRLDEYTRAFQSLQSAAIWQKPFLFIRYAKRDVILDTLSHFEWGISFSAESGVYLGVGLLIGYAAYSFLQAALKTSTSLENRSSMP